MIRGIDVSDNNGTIDWASVKAEGYAFAMIRCGIGNNAPDSTFVDNVSKARDAGVVIGAYHDAFPLSHIDPVENARDHFQQSRGLGSQRGDLPPALDVEWPSIPDFAKWKCTPGQVLDWCYAYLCEAEKLHGVPPMLYTYPWYWKTLLAGYPDESAQLFARFTLWMANETDPHDVMSYVEPWSTSVIRQLGPIAHLSNGSKVDVDIVPSPDALALLCGRAAAGA